VVGVPVQFVAEIDSAAGDWVEYSHADEDEHSHGIDDEISFVLQCGNATTQLGYTGHRAVVIQPYVHQLTPTAIMTRECS